MKYNEFVSRKTHRFGKNRHVWISLLQWLSDHPRFGISDFIQFLEGMGVSNPRYYLTLLKKFGYLESIVIRTYQVTDQERIKLAIKKQMLLNYNYKEKENEMNT